MDINKIKSLTSNGALGLLDIRKAQVGYNGYGFVFFDFQNILVDSIFRKWSGKVCGAGANFGDFEKFRALDEIKFDKLSNIDSLKDDVLQDLLLAGSLKTLLPDLKFGGDEMLFLVLMFVMTPDNLFFPAIFYYGASGTSLGGWRLEKYQKFPREICEKFNFSPFDLDKDGLTGLIEAQMFALKKVPVSDFCGIYSHDLGNTLMGVYDGVAFIQDLGYEYGENDVKILLDYLDYDFERDKFNFREIVKNTLNP